jgi:hypothetical protein
MHCRSCSIMCSLRAPLLVSGLLLAPCCSPTAAASLLVSCHLPSLLPPVRCFVKRSMEYHSFGVDGVSRNECYSSRYTGFALLLVTPVVGACIYAAIHLPFNFFTQSARESLRSLVSVSRALPWRRSRHRCTRYALSMSCLLLARRARPRSHPALILPKHSPERATSECCLLTFNRSRFSSDEL